MLTIDEAVQLIIKRKKELNEEIKLEEIKQDFEEEDTDDFTTSPHFNAQMKLATYITRMKKDIDPYKLSHELNNYWNKKVFTNIKLSSLSEEERALWDLCEVVSTMNVKI